MPANNTYVFVYKKKVAYISFPLRKSLFNSLKGLRVLWKNMGTYEIKRKTNREKREVNKKKNCTE